jgi:hypothetical protein
MSITITPPNTTFIDIFDLADTVRRLKGLTPEGIELILSRADEEIKPKPTNLPQMVEDLCYDEVFLGLAGQPYENPNSRLIKAGIADYLLNRN